MQSSKKGLDMNVTKKAQKGFTLIELMITVAIVAILAAVAIPNYSAYVMRGKAAEATSTLALLKNRMEQYYQDNKTYLDIVGPPALTAPCSPQAGTTKYFTYDCAARQTASQFTLTATPIANQGVNNFSFTIDEAGNKTSTFDGSPSANCWLTSKSGSC